MIDDVIVQEDDDVAAGEEESIDNPNQMRYECHNNNNINNHQQQQQQIHGLQSDGGIGDMGVQPLALYAPDAEIQPVNGVTGSDQLTLSFQGEVYVFDAVSPEKVGFLFISSFSAELIVHFMILHVCVDSCNS